MKRNGQFRVARILCIVAAFCPSAWAKYGGGTGTAADPYLISTAEHLRSFSIHRSDWRWEGHYKLTADIDLAELTVPIEPMGTMDFPFMGDFDGNSKTISNLRITSSASGDVGLFGYSSATVHDLRLVNVSIDAPNSKCVGALVGRQAGNELYRCHVDSGTVMGGEEVGGLVGNNLSTVTQCSTACTVSGGNKVGGLLGWHTEHQIVSQCYSTAAVSGAQDVGGLIGVNRGVLKDCYAISDVRGSFPAGGLMANSTGDGSIWNCYAAGPISSSGTAVGLCGTDALCFACFWDTETTGQASSACGTGKTTAQMRHAATFAGWGRSGAWTIDEGVDYPRLAWEGKKGTPLTTSAFSDWEGDGTPTRPYLIRTVEQLDAIGGLPGEWDKYYRLEADLDLAELTGPFHIIGCQDLCFTGTFDGNMHSIANFTCPYASYGAGMFGWTHGATIKRLTLINPHAMLDWSISVGPLIGQQNEGTVEACGAEGGSVASTYFVGGLVGRCSYGVVTRCYSTCSVAGQNAAEDAGGLIGKGERCNVNNSYATGAVSGGRYVGGLIGRVTDAGNVTHCYSTGRVTGSRDVGGFIGFTDKTLVTGCFWDVQSSQRGNATGGRGCLTAEMYRASTYIQAGWDFEAEKTNGTADIWCIDEGKDYPKFFTGPVIPPERVWADDFADGEPMPLWQVFERTSAELLVQEVNGRLELNAPVEPAGAYALYVSDGWALDGAKDFFLRIDFHFNKAADGKAYVSIGLTPSPDNPLAQYVDLTAGCQDGQPVHTGRLSAGSTRQEWTAFRGCDTGTLYISYSAASDELYRSFVGYGPVNAWHVATGLKAYWAGKPLYVILGGSDVGMTVSGSEAWLDNFSVDGGDVLE
jgi:hypothetical protein